MRGEKETRLARWFNTHNQVITTSEARLLGITQRQLDTLHHQERVHHPHRGVWVHAHHLENRAVVRCAAALAAAGPRAALSHNSASWVWQMLEQPPPTVDLLVPYGAHREIPGVRVHRAREPFVVRTSQGLRLTTPLRTLIDLADRSPKLLTVALDRTLMKQLVRFSDLAAAAEPSAGTHRPGVVALRAHLKNLGYLGSPAPSVLESRMSRLILAAGVPAPQAEYVAGEGGTYRIDFAWPAVKLAIEVDGYAWHHDPEKVAADNARRNHLLAHGWQILVYTWPQIRDDPDRVVAEIVQAYRRLAA